MFLLPTAVQLTQMLAYSTDRQICYHVGTAAQNTETH